MEIHQKISKPDYQKLETMVKKSKHQKLRLRKFDAWNERIETGQWLRVARDQVVLTGNREFAFSGKQKDSVRRETNAVSGAAIMIVPNQHQNPLHLLSHQHREVEVRREKGTSKAGVHLGRPIDSRAETSWKELALSCRVTIGILPSVSLRSLNRDVKSAISARFGTERLRNSRIKSRIREVTQLQWFLWKV